MSSIKHCIVPGCIQSPEAYQPLHRFPNPKLERERFDTWVHAVGGEIMGLEDEYIFKQRRICRRHFDVKFLCRNDRLSNTAVPTLNMPDSTIAETKNSDDISNATEQMQEFKAFTKMETPIVNYRKPIKSDAERAREYRARKKAKIESAATTESKNSGESCNASTVEVNSQLGAAMTTTDACMNETQATNDLLTIQRKPPKTPAERGREYRARKKLERVHVRKRRKTDAERAREYRARKKAEVQQAAHIMYMQGKYPELLQKVKVEICERDPADDNSALLARLQQNQQISVKKESELLDRDTKMHAKTKLPNQQCSSDNTNDKKNETLNQNNYNSFKNVYDTEIKVEPTTFIDHLNASEKIKDEYCDNHDNEEEKEDKSPYEKTVSDTEAKTSVSLYDKNASINSNIAIKLPGETTTESSSKNSGSKDKCWIELINVPIKQEPTEVALEPISRIDENLITNVVVKKEMCAYSSEYNVTKIESMDSNIETDGDGSRSIKQEEFIAKEMKREPKEEVGNMFQSIGENFSVSADTISEPFLVNKIETSDDE